MHSKALVQKLEYVNPCSQNNKNNMWPFLVALQPICKQGMLLDVMVLEHVLSNEGSLLIVAIYIYLHTAKVTRELPVFQDL
jgi:hypothetical protein